MRETERNDEEKESSVRRTVKIEERERDSCFVFVRKGERE